MANNRKQPPEGPGLQSLIYAVLVGVAFMAVLSVISMMNQAPSAAEISYTAFKNKVRAGEIAAVTLSGDRIDAEGPAAAGGEAPEFTSRAPAVGDAELLPMLEDAGVEVSSKPEPQAFSFGWLLPFALIIAFYVWMGRRLGGGGGFPGGGGILGRRAWRLKEKGGKVKFADVAGQEAAKREVSELVDFLRDPDRFARVGARVPRGVLLMGPPGTGKTLLARALAGEAGVPFYSTTGSSFIEVYVGVGAGRVRQMFEEARKTAPSIVFIDELDSIGRVRGAGFGGGHDEREQTLNQILAEMDGFDESTAVVVLAATNRPDVLDPALLRPGRFDRHVTLNLPDKAGRRAILDIYAPKVPLAEDADLDSVAAGTPGFSGADLRNLINEAAIAAARESDGSVRMKHLNEARDRVMMGTVRTLAIQPEEKHRIAVHESGHAAAAYHLPNADPLYKVTIIPRGRSLGGTHMLPEEERHTLPQAYLTDQLAIMLAGRAAEKVFLGSVSSGADDDIARATKLARSMVARWGMSEEIGPMDIRQSDEHPFLGREMAQPRAFSDEMAAKADEAVSALLHEAEARAEEVMTRHKPAVGRLIEALETRETLSAAEIKSFLNEDAAAA